MTLIVRSDRAGEFLSREQIGRRPDVTLAVFRAPVLTPLAQNLFPRLRISSVASSEELPGRPDVDGTIGTKEQAVAWTSSRPATRRWCRRHERTLPVRLSDAAGIDGPPPLSGPLPAGRSGARAAPGRVRRLDRRQAMRAGGRRCNLLDDMLLPWWTRASTA